MMALPIHPSEIVASNNGDNREGDDFSSGGEMTKDLRIQGIMLRYAGNAAMCWPAAQQIQGIMLRYAGNAAMCWPAA